MIKLIFGLGLLAILIIAALGLALIWLVKSRYRGRRAPAAPVLDAIRTPTSKFGACARCGEQRIIISESEGMCASCYSALRTKAT
jgi:hypothetical protein